MIWAEWAIVATSLFGAVVLVLLALRLWRRVKAFLHILASGAAGLAAATAALESAQTAGAARSGRPDRGAAYTDRIPT